MSEDVKKLLSRVTSSAGYKKKDAKIPRLGDDEHAALQRHPQRFKTFQSRSFKKRNAASAAASSGPSVVLADSKEQDEPEEKMAESDDTDGALSAESPVKPQRPLRVHVDRDSPTHASAAAAAASAASADSALTISVTAAPDAAAPSIDETTSPGVRRRHNRALSRDRRQFVELEEQQAQKQPLSTNSASSDALAPPSSDSPDPSAGPAAISSALQPATKRANRTMLRAADISDTTTPDLRRAIARRSLTLQPGAGTGLLKLPTIVDDQPSLFDDENTVETASVASANASKRSSLKTNRRASGGAGLGTLLSSMNSSGSDPSQSIVAGAGAGSLDLAAGSKLERVLRRSEEVKIHLLELEQKEATLVKKARRASQIPAGETDPIAAELADVRARIQVLKLETKELRKERRDLQRSEKDKAKAKAAEAKHRAAAAANKSRTGGFLLLVKSKRAKLLEQQRQEAIEAARIAEERVRAAQQAAEDNSPTSPKKWTLFTSVATFFGARSPTNKAGSPGHVRKGSGFATFFRSNNDALSPIHAGAAAGAGANAAAGTDPGDAKAGESTEPETKEQASKRRRALFRRAAILARERAREIIAEREAKARAAAGDSIGRTSSLPMSALPPLAPPSPLGGEIVTDSLPLAQARLLEQKNDTAKAEAPAIVRVRTRQEIMLEKASTALPHELLRLVWALTVHRIKLSKDELRMVTPDRKTALAVRDCAVRCLQTLPIGDMPRQLLMIPFGGPSLFKPAQSTTAKVRVFLLCDCRPAFRKDCRPHADGYPMEIPTETLRHLLPWLQASVSTIVLSSQAVGNGAGVKKFGVRLGYSSVQEHKLLETAVKFVRGIVVANYVASGVQDPSGMPRRIKRRKDDQRRASKRSSLKRASGHAQFDPAILAKLKQPGDGSGSPDANVRRLSGQGQLDLSGLPINPNSRRSSGQLQLDPASVSPARSRRASGQNQLDPAAIKARRASGGAGALNLTQAASQISKRMSLHNMSKRASATNLAAAAAAGGATASAGQSQNELTVKSGGASFKGTKRGSLRRASGGPNSGNGMQMDPSILEQLNARRVSGQSQINLTAAAARFSRRMTNQSIKTVTQRAAGQSEKDLQVSAAGESLSSLGGKAGPETGKIGLLRQASSANPTLSVTVTAPGSDSAPDPNAPNLSPDEQFIAAVAVLRRLIEEAELADQDHSSMPDPSEDFKPPQKLAGLTGDRHPVTGERVWMCTHHNRQLTLLSKRVDTKLPLLPNGKFSPEAASFRRAQTLNSQRTITLNAMDNNELGSPTTAAAANAASAYALAGRSNDSVDSSGELKDALLLASADSSPEKAQQQQKTADAAVQDEPLQTSSDLPLEPSKAWPNAAASAGVVDSQLYDVDTMPLQTGALNTNSLSVSGSAQPTSARQSPREASESIDESAPRSARHTREPSGDRFKMVAQQSPIAARGARDTPPRALSDEPGAPSASAAAAAAALDSAALSAAAVARVPSSEIKAQPQPGSAAPNRWRVAFPKGINSRAAPRSNATLLCVLPGGAIVTEIQRVKDWLQHDQGWSVIKVGARVALEQLRPEEAATPAAVAATTTAPATDSAAAAIAIMEAAYAAPAAKVVADSAAAPAKKPERGAFARTETKRSAAAAAALAAAAVSAQPDPVASEPASEPASAAVSTKSESNRWRVVAAKGINVRSEPKSSAQLLGVLPAGTVLTASQREGDWLQHGNGWSLIKLGANVALEQLPDQEATAGTAAGAAEIAATSAVAAEPAAKDVIDPTADDQEENDATEKTSTANLWRVTFHKGINVRAEPNPKAELVCVLPAGSVLTEMQRSGDWLQHAQGWSVIQVGNKVALEQLSPADAAAFLGRPAPADVAPSAEPAADADAAVPRLRERESKDAVAASTKLAATTAAATVAAAVAADERKDAEGNGEDETADPVTSPSANLWRVMFHKGINVRTGPNPKADLVCVLPAGSVLTEMQRKGDWLEHAQGWSVIQVGNKVALEQLSPADAAAFLGLPAPAVAAQPDPIAATVADPLPAQPGASVSATQPAEPKAAPTSAAPSAAPKSARKARAKPTRAQSHAGPCARPGCTLVGEHRHFVNGQLRRFGSAGTILESAPPTGRVSARPTSSAALANDNAVAPSTKSAAVASAEPVEQKASATEDGHDQNTALPPAANLWRVMFHKGINVRTEPNPKAELVCVLPAGSVLTEMQRAGDWLQHAQGWSVIQVGNKVALEQLSPADAAAFLGLPAPAAAAPAAAAESASASPAASAAISANPASASAPANAPSSAAPTANRWRVMFPMGINVRATPKTNGQIVCVLPQGTVLAEIQRVKDWLQHPQGWSVIKVGSKIALEQLSPDDPTPVTAIDASASSAPAAASSAVAASAVDSSSAAATNAQAAPADSAMKLRIESVAATAGSNAATGQAAGGARRVKRTPRTRAKSNAGPCMRPGCTLVGEHRHFVNGQLRRFGSAGTILESAPPTGRITARPASSAAQASAVAAAAPEAVSANAPANSQPAQSLSESQKPGAAVADANVEADDAADDEADVPVQPAPNRWRVMFHKGINVRAEPNPKGALVCVLPAGTIVTEIRRVQDWMQHDQGWSVIQVGNKVALEQVPSEDSAIASDAASMTRSQSTSALAKAPSAAAAVPKLQVGGLLSDEPKQQAAPAVVSSAEEPAQRSTSLPNDPREPATAAPPATADSKKTPTDNKQQPSQSKSEPAAAKPAIARQPSSTAPAAAESKRSGPSESKPSSQSASTSAVAASAQQTLKQAHEIARSVLERVVAKPPAASALKPHLPGHTSGAGAAPAATLPLDDLPWLHSALKDSAQSKEWASLREAILQLMREFVESHSRNPQRQQCLFAVVGAAFMATYFPSVKFDAALLQPPFMLPESRAALEARLQHECLGHIIDRLPKIAKSDEYKGYAESTVALLIKSYHAKPAEGTAAAAGDGKASAATSAHSALAFVKLCENNATLKAKIQAFRGSSLPKPLRQFVWAQVLQDADSKAKCARETTERAKFWGIQDYAQSPMQGHIGKLVTTATTSFLNLPTPGMAQLLTQTLNHYYLATEKYGFRETVIASQLVRTFPEEKYQSLTPMLLHLLDRCVPSPAVSRQLANLALSRLRELDADMHTHMSECFEAGGSIALTGARGLPVPEKPATLLARWIEHGFVGFLSPAATELVWDQCFLVGWNRTDFLCELSVQLLLLLRPHLAAAKTRDSLDTVTATELSNLLTRQVLSVVRPIVQKLK